MVIVTAVPFVRFMAHVALVGLVAGMASLLAMTLVGKFL